MKKDKASIQEILKQGMQTEFWDIIVEELNNQITQLHKEKADPNLRNLPAGEYKLYNELLFAKIDYLENLQKLPGDLIMQMESPSAKFENLDPYRKARDFKQS